MADRMLLDTNVILDFVLERQAGFADADRIWRAIGSSRLVGYVTASAMTDIFYFASNKGDDPARGYSAVTMCLSVLSVCPVDRAILDQAVGMGRPDFEDSVQIAAALAEGLDAIVTHDIKGFKNAGIKLYTPAQLVKELKIR